jgi:hypothetical protein
MEQKDAVFTHMLKKSHSVNGVHIDSGTKCYFESTPMSGGWANQVVGKPTTTICYENGVIEDANGVPRNIFQKL